MSIRSLRNPLSAVLLTAVAPLALTLALPASALGEMAISEAKTECVANVPYPMIEAAVDPVPEQARVYFRAADGDVFYFIEMAGGDGKYQGVLPVPSAETSQIVYYVEAISADADASRTPEYQAEVRDEGQCAGRLYFGADPKIAIHSTAPGVAALPQGFLSNGVAVTVSTAGATTAVAPVAGAVAAGGLGAGAVTGIVAGSAAAGAVIIDELDDDEEDAASPSDP